MSIINLPRRIQPTTPRHRSPKPVPNKPSAPSTSRTTRFESKQPAVRNRLLVKSAAVVILALVVSVFGALENAQRQVQLHNNQTELLNLESSYAVQLGTVSNLSAPNVIASNAASLHLVDPRSVSQIAATSLSDPLRTPVFTTPVIVTPRTSR